MIDFLELPIPYPWVIFSACFLLAIICSVVMSAQSKRFRYLRGIATTPFSIMDLEFPGSVSAIAHIVTGIKDLNNDTGSKSYVSLRNNLRLDFLFMAGIYPAIFVLCMHLSLRMESVGRTMFIILAWLQAFSWLFDILENIYLLRKLSKPYSARQWVHSCYRWIVALKWVFATTGGISALFGWLHYWINGHYGHGFLITGFVIAGLLGIFLVLSLIKLIRAVMFNSGSA